MTDPAIARSVAALRSQVGIWRQAGQTVGFVPTMGALHEGHLSLVRLAGAEADRVVVSIFVNPTQFAPTEDLDRYPRDEAGDLAKLAAIGAHLVYMPTVAEMYPEGATTWVEVKGLSEGLCADSRPHHFRGVATVVTKLLNQVQADVAVFGEKDYQQLMVIKRLARDLAIPTRIAGGPTVREPDGLAMSSRNLNLATVHRRIAPSLNRILRIRLSPLRTVGPQGRCWSRRHSGCWIPASTTWTMCSCGMQKSLAPLAALDGRPARLLAAAHLGGVRLIDNIPVAGAAT